MAYLLVTNPHTKVGTLIEMPEAAVPYVWDQAWEEGLDVEVCGGCKARRLIGEGEVINRTGLHRWPDGTGHRTPYRKPTLSGKR